MGSIGIEAGHANVVMEVPLLPTPDLTVYIASAALVTVKASNIIVMLDFFRPIVVAIDDAPFTIGERERIVGGTDIRAIRQDVSLHDGCCS